MSLARQTEKIHDSDLEFLSSDDDLPRATVAKRQTI